jgi:hypothetical protein
VTTEALLRDTLEFDDAGELFRWLREQSFIEISPAGLVPHDLARTCLTWTSRRASTRPSAGRF